MTPSTGKPQIKIDLYFVNVFRKTLYVSFLWIIGCYVRSVENKDQSNWRWKSYYIQNALWDTMGSSKLSFRNTKVSIIFSVKYNPSFLRWMCMKNKQMRLEIRKGAFGVCTYTLDAATSSGILKAKQKLGVTFHSDKLGGIDFTKFSKLSMCSAGASRCRLVLEARLPPRHCTWSVLKIL